MNILIAAASGFVGRYAVREAVARGHHDETTLTRSTGRRASRDHAQFIEWFQCDLGDVEASTHS
jgi:uncharacterized protein YbjT (DUF2867 family)